jgi:hypothetical protein
MTPYILGEHKFNLPTCWEDVTTKQWFQLRDIDLTDTCGILSILSGLDRDLWFNTREIDVAEKILPALDFMKQQTDLSKYPVPAKIKIGDREIEVTKDIRLKTFGARCTYQHEYAKYMNEKGDAAIEFLPINLSIYLCPEPFSDSKAKELIDQVMEIPITQAYPTAAFFLSNFVTS